MWLRTLASGGGGSRKHGTYVSGSLKGGKFDYISDYQLLKKESTSVISRQITTTTSTTITAATTTAVCKHSGEGISPNCAQFEFGNTRTVPTTEHTNLKVHMRDSSRDFIGTPNTGQLFTSGDTVNTVYARNSCLENTAYKNAGKNVPVNTR